MKSTQEMRRHRDAEPYVPTFLKHAKLAPPALATTSCCSWTVTEGSSDETPVPPAHRELPNTVLLDRSYKEAVLTGKRGATEEERSNDTRRIYDREQLLRLRSAVLEELRRGEPVEAPPYGLVPRAFEALLQDARAQWSARVQHDKTAGTETYTEYLDGWNAARLLSDSKLSSSVSASVPQPSYWCCVCAAGKTACPVAQAWLDDTRKEIFSPSASRALRCLAQPPEVFRSLLQISLILESKRGSARLRWIAEQYQAVPDRIREFLCGTAEHVPLPPITSHEEWTEMSGWMGFDAVRDNRTRIITDFSRHWKRRTIPYEQFLFFYSFRDHVPPGHVKNIVTRSVKPGMAAMLISNVPAMVLLHHHQFFIPQDHYWDVFRFLEAATGGDGHQYRKIRHLGLYLSASQQDMHFFSPVEAIRDSFTAHR